jgi:hypothetical protein
LYSGVPDSHLCWDTDYPDSWWYAWVPPENARIVPRLGHDRSLSNPFRYNLEQIYPVVFPLQGSKARTHPTSTGLLLKPAVCFTV